MHHSHECLQHAPAFEKPRTLRPFSAAVFITKVSTKLPWPRLDSSCIVWNSFLEAPQTMMLACHTSERLVPTCTSQNSFTPPKNVLK